MKEKNEDKLQGVVDRQQIYDVVFTYCRGIDRMDKALVRACYHPDATDEHGSFKGGVEEYLQWCWGLLEKYSMTMHYISNCLIELEGDRAMVESYGVAIHRGATDRPQNNLTTGFRFIDVFERRDDEWKILSRVATTEWVRQNLPEQDWPLHESMRQGSRDKSDPVYQSWRSELDKDSVEGEEKSP